MSWCLFSRPWMFVKEDETSRESRQAIFRNHLQSLSETPPTNEVPSPIDITIVDAMRVVRLIQTTGLKKRTFRCWAERIAKYLLLEPLEKKYLIRRNFVGQNFRHQTKNSSLSPDEKFRPIKGKCLKMKFK